MIVAGLGFSSKANAQSILNAIEKTGFLDQISAIATSVNKSENELFQDLATHLHLKTFALPEEVLRQVKTPNFSSRVHRLTGIGCLCEASALAAAGAMSVLIAERHVSTDNQATAAIATSKG